MEQNRVSQRWTWLGAILLIVGFLGHYFAARAIGGSYIAYRDHILGFFLILVVTGAIIAGLGWRFWKGRRDITVLIIGLVQALLGIWVYIGRYNVHG
jgi:4-amino-4-deoxy-L-arabinose transferase-like glycosyltransferase